jgi:hypothetical protein
VVMYKHTDDGFTRRVIAESDQRHYKEILVADVDDDGRPELYTVLEGVLQTAPGGPDGDVEIRRYRFDDLGRPTDKLVVTLPDKQCRFLHAGDIDGDGNKELVASAFKSGLWIIRPAEEGEWATECIDPDTSGYEHASVLADMDGDGTPEIYVADDQGKASGGQGKLRVYAWDGAAFEHANLFDLTPGDITFGLMAVLDGKYLGAD